jgi:hypothetical protein
MFPELRHYRLRPSFAAAERQTPSHAPRLKQCSDLYFARDIFGLVPNGHWDANEHAEGAVPAFLRVFYVIVSSKSSCCFTSERLEDSTVATALISRATA